MSKKTKKQKIIADRRRKFFSLSKLSKSLNQETEIHPPENKKNSETARTAQYGQNTSIYSYPIHEIHKDLTKTLLLCILAISFEIALYFILEKNLNLPFKLK